MKKIRLFVDMDGTLSVFTPVDTLEKLYEPGYFFNQQPQINVVLAIRELIKNPAYNSKIEVFILSAVLRDHLTAKDEKNRWLDMFLPDIDYEHRIYTVCGENKTNYIENFNQADVLLDDYTTNLVDWDPPGKGIKLLNGINHTNGTWKGKMVDLSTEPKALAKRIYSFAQRNRDNTQKRSSNRTR